MFVGMLPKTVTELDLQEMFGPYGQLKEIHIIRGPDGNSKGCAFVKFLSQESALMAIQELNDTIPEGSARPLVIKMADSKRSLRDGFDDAISTASGADVRDYWMAPQSSSSTFPHPDQSTHSMSPSQYPMPVPHSPMMSQNSGMPMAYMSYSHSGPGAPSPHLQSTAPSYMFYHGYYSPDVAHTPTSPPSNMGLMSMSPGGPVMYQLPALSMSPPSSNPAFYQMSSDPNQGALPPGVYENRPSEKSENSTRQLEGPVGANLFIYHLPRDLTDADLATLFAPFGEVISAKVFMDKKTAESKGFGRVATSPPASHIHRFRFFQFCACCRSRHQFHERIPGDSSPFHSSVTFSSPPHQIGSKRLKVQHKRVGGYPEPMPISYPSVALPRGSPASRNDQSVYPTGIPINVSPYYQQNPYLSLNGTTDSVYSQHALGMAQSPPMGMAYLQSPYGSQPIPAQYMGYAATDPQRRMAAAGYPPPPMYLNQSPPSRPPYYGYGHRAPYDPSTEALSQSFDHALHLNPEGGGGGS